MKFIFEKNENLCKTEIYNEYLKKIPQLVKQIEVVERMIHKANIEAQMLQNRDADTLSIQKYKQSLEGIQSQCEIRWSDLKEELDLIMSLKLCLEKDLPFYTK